ncbi:unnamed protein product [Phyllotreta striolata]|uniref:MADF domain-containing protein n=1 Tax=Phyllotreta striolata TaxID=444603 RepID=A0A9N9XNH4_PHYSR|nr:unnamed protein product [Phyllotreta striolata]
MSVASFRKDSKSASSLKLSETNTARLLELYRREPCLYDQNSRDYRDREARSAALIRIASELSVDGFGTQEVQTKFKNLRNSYSQELKKIEEGADADRPYVPKVHWFGIMDSFIRPQMYKYARPSKGNSVQKRERRRCKRSASSEASEASDEAENIYFKEEEPSVDWTGFEFNDSASRAREDEAPVAGSSASNASRTSGRASGHQEDKIVKAVRRLTEATKLAACSKQGDMYDKFGGFVAEVLRKAGYNKSLLIINDISKVLAQHAVEKAPSSLSECT